MSDPLTDLFNDVQHNGIRWVTLVTVFSLWRKERRNQLLNKRDAANFHNQREIMIALEVGDKWIDGPKLGLSPADLLNLRRFFLLSRKATQPETVKHQKRRVFQLKEYLKKLGSRKFQAFLIITVTNVIMLTGYLLNVANIQEIADSWMPIINLLVQAVTTIVYQIVQGGVDKEAQKQQVYVVPADPAAAITPAVTPSLPDLPETFDEFMTQVDIVNTEFNRCLDLIKSHNFVEVPKEALELYRTAHYMISLIKQQSDASKVEEP